MRRARAFRIGILSDTHGLLRPEARSFLVGCDHIIHGGDVGSAHILDDLAAIAPVTAVRGNNDTDAWARDLPDTAWVRFSHVFAYVIHDLAELDIEPKARDVRLVVSGHSHVPKITDRDGVVFLNPGSCGPRRFRLPISVGEVMIHGETLQARTLELDRS